MTSVSFYRVFSAAHRLLHDDSKCHNIHGHNYEVEVEIRGEVQKSGFIIPFDIVKDLIDRFDHCLILHKDDPVVELLWSWDREELCVQLVHVDPTTENLAEIIANSIYEHLEGHCAITLTLRETDGIEATVDIL